MDLRRLEVVPEDSPRTGVLAVDLDHRTRGGDDVDGQVVATTVWSSIFPASIRIPYSRSWKPPPLPILAPVRFTATEPQRTKSISGISSSATIRPCRSAPLIVAASRICFAFSFFGSRTRNGCLWRSRGTAITRAFPSSRARRRPCVWGESGFAFTTRARFQARCEARRSAASFAPAKFGMRPSAPGKRETPSRSIARQTAVRTWSLVRTAET